MKQMTVKLDKDIYDSLKEYLKRFDITVEALTEELIFLYMTEQVRLPVDSLKRLLKSENEGV